MSDKIKISFNIDKDTRKQVKQIALDKETTATELYNKWILEGIKRETKQARLDENF